MSGRLRFVSSSLAVLTDFATTGLDELVGNVSRASGHPVRLLILDPAGDFLDADENDAGPVKKLMRLLREKATAHGCTILLLGHVAKGGGGTSMGNGFYDGETCLSRVHCDFRVQPTLHRVLVAELTTSAAAFVLGLMTGSVFVSGGIRCEHIML